MSLQHTAMTFYLLVKMKAALTDKSKRRFRNFKAQVMYQCLINKSKNCMEDTRIIFCTTLCVVAMCFMYLIYTALLYILQSIDHISTHITTHDTKAKAKC